MTNQGCGYGRFPAPETGERVDPRDRVVQAARALLKELRVPVAGQQPKVMQLAFELHDALYALDGSGS